MARVREARLVIKRHAPPTRLLEEREEGIAEKIEKGLARFAKLNVPKIVGNIMFIAVGFTTFSLLWTSLNVMMPYAVQVYAIMGRLIGFMIPLLFIYMMFSLVIGIAKVIT